MTFRSPLLRMALGLGLVAPTLSLAGDFSAEDYQKALWMATRFYGAQRSGEGPNWLLMDHTYTTSFVKDADGSVDLTGGWFDCGDHVTFGQTFFYSAYMLGLAYSEFPTGYPDLYDGTNYSNYADKGDWSYSGNEGNGIPDLLEELKYATDWIIKATPNSSTFYYQKGNGDYDHKNWVTSGYMSTLAITNGGESTGSRPVYKNPSDGIMPSYAAAALAVMSRIYRKYDADYADTCLAHAKFAYAYAGSYTSSVAGDAQGGTYYSSGNMKTPQAAYGTAAAELYETTGTSSYLTTAKSYLTDSYTYYMDYFDYANPQTLGALARARITGTLTWSTYKSSYVSKYAAGVGSDNSVSSLGNSSWGALRYVGNFGFAAAIYARDVGTSDSSTYKTYIYNQADYILGSNNANQSFIVGFCSGCSNSPQHPHHRNVYLDDGNVSDAAKQNLDIPTRNEQLGYMVGGTWTSTSYSDQITSYAYTEGGIDYNAGLVGLLGYINSIENPVDTAALTGTTRVSRTPVAGRAQLKVSPAAGGASFTLDNGAQIDRLEVFTPAGQRVESLQPRAARVEWAGRAGLYVVRAVSGSSSWETTVFVH